MTTQPEALRLADELEMWTKGEPAAAELRRLHEAHESSLRTIELLVQRDELIKLNQELLAALKGALWRMEQYNYQAMEGTIANVRAAIAKAEGEAK